MERALASLRAAERLSIGGIRETPLSELEKLVRSSGYFRQKAQRLKNFVAFLDARYEGSLERMFAAPTEQLRTELLALNGIGPETADSILLYAGNHGIFVVDAYTRRILERHEAVGVERSMTKSEPSSNARCSVNKHRRSSQSAAKQRPGAHPPSAMSMAQRNPLTQVYNEMHGLFVQAGKHYCQKSQARCEACPLGRMLSAPTPRHKTSG